MNLVVFQKDFIYKHWNLSFIQFLYVIKYSSSDSFQIFKNKKMFLIHRSYKSIWRDRFDLWCNPFSTWFPPRWYSWDSNLGLHMSQWMLCYGAPRSDHCHPRWWWRCWQWHVQFHIQSFTGFKAQLLTDHAQVQFAQDWRSFLEVRCFLLKAGKSWKNIKD